MMLYTHGTRETASMFLSLKDFFRLFLFVLGGLLAVHAWALQISKPVLLSYLGQPLRLQFTVSDVTQVEQQALQINLAEPHIYESTQIRRAPGLDKLQFQITPQSDGTYQVLVSGDQPMVEERADLIIDFDWATGRRYMNIGVKLDPAPAQAQSAPAAPAPATAASPSPSPSPSQETTTAPTPAAQTPEIGRAHV